MKQECNVTYECKGGEQVAIDWVLGEILHANDDQWHPWEESIRMP